MTSISVLFLPETLNMRLAETIEEAGVFEKATASREESQDNKNDSRPSEISAHENVVNVSDEGV